MTQFSEGDRVVRRRDGIAGTVTRVVPPWGKTERGEPIGGEVRVTLDEGRWPEITIGYASADSALRPV